MTNKELLIRFDECMKEIRAKAKKYFADYIWQERLEALNKARELLESQEPTDEERKEKREQLVNHLVYMDSPPNEGEAYQWLGSYILKWGKDEIPKVGVRELTEEELSLILSSGKQKVSRDDRFISHVQAHLKEGEKVICKICGKTASEIIDEANVEVEK